jgi:AraC-like DNA-binding protein
MSRSRQAAIAASDDQEVKIRSFALNLPSGRTVLPHSDVWHQLIYAIRGVMTVRTVESAWVVPPHRAVWIPAHVRFAVETAGAVAMRTLYVRSGMRRGGWSAKMPRACAVVNVTPLLRELILRATQLGALDERLPEQRHLVSLILDELKVLMAMPLQLPMPQDQRGARLAALLNGGDRRPMKSLLRECGGSRRTMERVFRAETGMSLGQWQRRQKLLDALRRLAAGESVSGVALELGYNSASAFVAMFRRELGQTPGRYFEP